MFDTEKFIVCVHANPALWDKSLKAYSDRNEREKCWVMIGQAMFADWSEIDVKEKDLKMKDMKNKWRHIRDCFMKYLNIGKSGDPTPSKKKKYVYADALTFLLNSTKKRPKSGSIKVNESEEVDDVPNIDEEEVHPTTTAPASWMESNPRNQRITTFHSQPLTQLGLSAWNEEDPDRLYILSLLGDYKKLNEDEKLDFKLANIQFFRHALQRRAQMTVPPGQSPNK